jgi:hypothetical protein
MYLRSMLKSVKKHDILHHKCDYGYERNNLLGKCKRQVTNQEELKGRKTVLVLCHVCEGSTNRKMLMPCRSNGNEENFSLECTLQCKCCEVGSTAGFVFDE